jgi:hypothetical protein
VKCCSLAARDDERLTLAPPTPTTWGNHDGAPRDVTELLQPISEYAVNLSMAKAQATEEELHQFEQFLIEMDGVLEAFLADAKDAGFDRDYSIGKPRS